MDTDTPSRETGTDADSRSAFQTDARCDRLWLDLRSVVVEYEDRPNRRTVYPEGLASVDRMSTWLTGDDDAFVDLDEMR